jgi:hypothetical protein
MQQEIDFCICGHPREQHQHLLGTEVRYPCLQCPCPNFRKSA